MLRLHWDALKGLHVEVQGPIEVFPSTIVSRVGKKSIQKSNDNNTIIVIIVLLITTIITTIIIIMIIM